MEPQEPKEPKEPQEPKEPKEPKEPQEPQEPNVSRETLERQLESQQTLIDELKRQNEQYTNIIKSNQETIANLSLSRGKVLVTDEERFSSFDRYARGDKKWQ